ncbi:MAG TPA: VWA domain-containing protein, partial [Chloroflexota bacterium]
RPQDEASIIAFASTVQPLSGFTSDKNTLHQTIESIEAGGNTALYDALFTAVDSTSTAAIQRRVVILMSNGVNTRRGAALDDGLKLATQHEVPVYAIGMGPEIDRGVVTRIAEQTGGMSLVAPGPEALQSIYQAISDQMRQQYILTYQSPSPKGARTYHLAITANLGSQKVEGQRNFEANPEAPNITAVSLSDGARVEGMVPVTVEVSSAQPITHSKLVVNGRTLQEIVSPPFSFSLNAGRLTPGWQEVLLSVDDAAGSEVSQRLRVLVSPTAPSVTSTGEATPDSQGAPSAPIALNPGISIDLWGTLVSWIPARDVVGGLGSTWTGVTDRVSLIPQAGQTVVDQMGAKVRGIADGVGDGVFNGVGGVFDGVGSTVNGVGGTFVGVGGTFDRAGGTVNGVRERGSDLGALPSLAPTLIGRGSEAVQDNARPVACFGLMFIGFFGSLMGGKRGITRSRAQLRSVECEGCGGRYPAIADECPACRHDQDELHMQERSLGEFMVQNNVLTAERLADLIQMSHDQGQRLEITALEAGVFSARELSQARFYLSHSAEIYDRLSDAAHKQSGGTWVGRLLPAVSLPTSLVFVGLTTVMVTLQAL